jgi:tripeptidyl-peptidase-1
MRGIASVLLSAAIAAQTAFATPIRARSPYVVKETHYAPRDWTKLDRAHENHVIQMQIGLKQGNWDELERHLNEGESHEHEMSAPTAYQLQ